jgi:hypothetical protein
VSRREKLPKECLVVIPGLPAGKNVAVSKRWREGLEITQLNFGDEAAARLRVRRLNAVKGTTAVEEHAMLAGPALDGMCPTPILDTSCATTVVSVSCAIRTNIRCTENAARRFDGGFVFAMSAVE